MEGPVETDWPLVGPGPSGPSKIMVDDMRYAKESKHEGRHTEHGKRAHWGTAALLALSLVLTGCLGGEGGGPSYMMQILEPEETPEHVEDCEFRVRPFSEEDLMEGDWDDFEWEDEDHGWDEGEYEVPEPEEFGYQNLGQAGVEHCEDGDYLIILYYMRYAAEDFEQAVKGHEESKEFEEEWGNAEWDDEYEDDWYDPCTMGVTMWGDDQVVSALAMDPAMMSGDYDYMNAEMLTGHESAMENVTQALKTKFPGMESIC